MFGGKAKATSDFTGTCLYLLALTRCHRKGVVAEQEGESEGGASLTLSFYPSLLPRRPSSAFPPRSLLLSLSPAALGLQAQPRVA